MEFIKMKYGEESETFSYDKNNDFTLIALMFKNKFDLFPKKDIDAIVNDKQIEIKDVKIKDSNDPQRKIEATLITTSW